MKFADAGTGLEQVERFRDVNGNWESRLPNELGTTHGLWDRPKKLVLLDYPSSRAVCGRLVAAVMPVAFDSNAPSACGKCARLLALRAEDPEGWEKRRQERWNRRNQERWKREELEAAEEQLLMLLDQGTITEGQYMASADDPVQAVREFGLRPY